MQLTLNRIARKPGYTIGRLYIDGRRFCDTLEDTDRGLTQAMRPEQIAGLKQRGATAIPTGTYRVATNIVSPRFSGRKQYAFCQGRLPRLLNVPGFEGILIHIGNTPKDTEGCILVGENRVKGQVVNSTATFKRLYERLKEADNISITVE